MKYDLRVYVLVTNFNPLKVYIYDDGLVRFATEKYTKDSKTLSKKFVHLTNFSINKRSSNFVKNPDTSKKSKKKKEAGDGQSDEESSNDEENIADKGTSSKWDFR